ncbi:MAG: PQQ-binding-like beta-propeller repeat protein [Promethearchaeati archaeon]
MNKKALIISIIAIILVASIFGVLLVMNWGDPDTTYDYFFETQEDQMFYYSSFAVDDDGNLYIGTSHKQYWQAEGREWSENYYLYSFYPNNTKRWEFPTSNSEVVKGGPAVHPDGLIIFVTEAMSSSGSQPNAIYNKLYALNTDGTLNWSSIPLEPSSGDIDDGPWGSNCLNPAIDSNGHIYIQSQDNITSFYKNGTIRWYNDSLTTPFKSSGSPSIYNDTVYFPSGGNSKISISAFYTNGTYKWHYEINYDDNRFNMISIDDSGLLYAGTDANTFHIINPDGTQNKTYPIPTSNAKVRGDIAIDSDGIIFLGTKNDQNSEFYALNTSGTEVSVKWKYNSPLRDVYSSPTIADDGSIFFATEDRKVFRVNKQNGDLIKIYEVERDITWCSCTFDDDSTLYIGDMGGYLYAIELSNVGLADTPWSCLGASFKRTRCQRAQ